MSFKIQSQLSENQIETDVSSYLAFVTPIWSKRYRLIKVDEAITGADKLFNRFLPIYLQFKVSHGLNANATIFQRFQNKPLSNIINYRKNNNISGNPILYFQLRRKARTATDFQHNVLRSLNNPPTQFALYIAPLTLEIREYEYQLDKDWYYKFYPVDPFGQRTIELNDSPLQKKLILRSNPFLRHHISIPPHISVSTHNHHYSYSKSGGDVTWHGGEILNDDFRLSNYITKIFHSFYFNGELGITLEKYLNFIRDFKFNNYRRIEDEISSPMDPFTLIQAFGRILKAKYDITLMILTETKENH